MVSHLRRVVGAALLAATTLFATMAPVAAASAKYKFDFANVTESGALFVQLQKGVVGASKVTGVSLKIYNNNFDGPTALQNAQLMVEDHPQVIIEYNAVAGIGKALGQMFNQHKIPCIAVNVPTPGCAWFNLSNKQMGIDTGHIVAKIAKAKGWTAKNTVVLLVQNSTAGTEVNNCVRYFYVTIAAAMGMHKVAPSAIGPSTTHIGPNLYQVNGSSDLQDSFTAVKNVLPSIPANKHILLYTVNDDSSLGAWQAVVDAHRQGATLVAGLGGDQQGLQQLRTNPHWVAEGTLFIQQWGEYIMAMAVAMLHGAKPPALTRSPQLVLTKTNVNRYYKGDNATRLPPLLRMDLYLKKTGVLQRFHNVPGV